MFQVCSKNWKFQQNLLIFAYFQTILENMQKKPNSTASPATFYHYVAALKKMKASRQIIITRGGTKSQVVTCGLGICLVYYTNNNRLKSNEKKVQITQSVFLCSSTWSHETYVIAQIQLQNMSPLIRLPSHL